jgi:hypothetical protein
MISKKRLKEKLLDICAGAGMNWTDEEYFEYDELQGECVGKIIVAIERRFNFGAETRLRTPWQLKQYEHIDTMVDLVLEVFKFDT